MFLEVNHPARAGIRTLAQAGFPKSKTDFTSYYLNCPAAFKPPLNLKGAPRGRAPSGN